MFSDLIKVANGPSLVSVVASLAKMTRKANMLADVSSIVEIGADRDQFERYARFKRG